MTLVLWSSSRYTFPLPEGHRFPVAKYAMLREAVIAEGIVPESAGAEFRGAQGWVGYRTGRVSSGISAVEPLLRVSYGDPDVDGDGGIVDAAGGTLVTPGVNLWLGGLNRIAINWELWNPDVDGEETVHSAKVLFQMAF